MTVIAKLQNDLESALLAVAEDPTAAMSDLCALVAQFPGHSLPPDAATTIEENLDVLLDDVSAVVALDTGRSLLRDLARRGLDSTGLRDALAEVCREDHSDYPDPAGMVRSLGILDPGTTIQKVMQRWTSFTCLRKGALVWHASFELGVIQEFDSFSDLIVVLFERAQTFHLESAVEQLAVALPDSVAIQYFQDRDKKFRPPAPCEEVFAEISASFCPPVADGGALAASILVPARMTDREFADWCKRKTAGGGRKKAGGSAAQGRAWYESRSLVELIAALEKEKAIDIDTDATDQLVRLFKAAAQKPKQCRDFGRALALLVSLSGHVDNLNGVIDGLSGEPILIWDGAQTYMDTVTRVPAKLVPGLHAFSARCRGVDWFITVALGLPLRFWPAAEEAITGAGGDLAALESEVEKRMPAYNVRADAIVWLWRRRGAEADVWSNCVTVFRALVHEAKGEFIKGKKELLRLLLDDDEFRAALMSGGSVDGIERFVTHVKHSMFLETEGGAQQSLLVKIVRQFPAARRFVEDRNKSVKKKAMPKMSSYRSYVERRTELKEIINVKIPENSRAIAHARSYGDLRENAEFKAAKEMQRLLGTRRQQLDKDLAEVIPTDFSNVTVNDVVIPGSAVDLVLAGDGDTFTYTLLGLWDSVPEKNVLSYDTPIGRLLMGKTIGDTVTLPEGAEATITDVNPPAEELVRWMQAPEGTLDSDDG